jgi:hypothetical protein
MAKNGGLIYFKDGEVIAEHGEAKVYKMNEQLYLEIGPGHNLWALESEISDYIHQLSDYPKGNCLEIGLGLGVASRYILTFPKVKHLTTVEINEDVIKAHELIEESERKTDLAYDPGKHRILNANGLEYMYQTNRRYDFIFIDCYDRIDEDTLPIIADMVIAASRIVKDEGRVVGWLDPNTPGPYAKGFFNLFGQIGQ